MMGHIIYGELFGASIDLQVKEVNLCAMNIAVYEGSMIIY